MALAARFEFPGFTLTGTADTPNHEVERGTIEENGTTFLLELIRSKSLSWGSFLIANVKNANGGKLLWQFPKGGEGIGLIVPTTYGSVIALVGPGRDGLIEHIIPLASLAGTGRQIGLRKQIKMKDEAGKFLGRYTTVTSAEKRLLAADKARKEEEASVRLAQLEGEKCFVRQVKEARREERRRVILSRAEICGFTADGKPRRGLPVLESEWQTLPDDDRAIIVESIGEDGTVGALVEWFKVRREPGRNPRKEFRTSVTAEKPVTTTSTGKAVPKHVGTAWIEMEDEEGELDEFEVLLFDSKEAIWKAREAGLNGGTRVAVKDLNPNGKLEVFRIGERFETLGHFVPVG